MHSVETYSRYLHQLTKEGKYENVLINFKENAANFGKEEIAKNSYLIGDILRCYREQGLVKEGLEFLESYEVDVIAFKDNYPIISFGWLLQAELKNLLEKEGESAAKELEIAVDFLAQIPFLDENFRLLASQLFSKIISLEKRKKPIVIDNILKLLKGINIKHERVKKIIASEPYTVSGIVDLFRKANHVERALGFLRFLNIKIDSQTPDQILNSYGWCLYAKLKLEIKDEGDDDSESSFDSLLLDFDEHVSEQTSESNRSSGIIELIEKSIALLSLESEYSPFSKLFNLTLKSEKQKSNPDWAWIENFLTLFKEKSLSHECDSIQFVKSGREKTVELASDFETWHAYYSLALLKQNKFQECLEASKKALFEIEKFHYNNDLWFARKIALSNKGLGNIPQAIKEMEAIEKRKGEWFIQKELSELHFENGDIENAQKLAIRAALSYGDKEKKDGLFFLLGQIYVSKGDRATAHRHFLLSQLIRSEHDWSIPNKLKLALEETYVEGVNFDNSASLYTDLLRLWKEQGTNSRDPNNNVSGKILNINVPKTIGTLEGVDGQKYFFHFSEFKNTKDKIVVGAKVKFFIKPPKGDQPGRNWVAYNITLQK